MQPKITVLMPVYNGENYVREAMESILNQTYQYFEFLIIDDGSTDKSVEIIESFIDERIRLVKNGQNIGLIATLNKGLDLASGKYVARMDCDDVSLPERLKHQVDFMEKNSKIGICGTWFRFIPTNEIIKYPTKHEDIILKLLTGNALAHPTVIMRTSILRENILYYDMNFSHAEDYEFWVRLAKIVKIANIPEVLLNYRMHDNQISVVYNKNQSEVVANIKINQLLDLGIELNDQEKLVYLSLIDGRVNGSNNYLLQKKIIDKIIKANAVRKIYNDDLLLKKMVDLMKNVSKNSKGSFLMGLIDLFKT